MPDPGAHGGRKARRGGAYTVFIPASIANRRFSFGEDTVASLAEATQALTRLNSTPPRLASLEALARNLLRSEGVASSRIEGLDVSHRRLARAAYAPERTAPGGDRRAAEVVANVRALEDAIARGARTDALTPDDLREIHRTLLRFTFDQHIAGVTRGSQNWIGGNAYNPVGADYVPPPAEHVVPLLDDLCAFTERDDIAPVAQAAIAHAQFETVHPFADGNGRVGRALIYAILRRRGDVDNYIPPISLILAQRKDEYIGGLAAFRDGDVDGWCARFADATTRASLGAGRLADAIDRLEAQWVEQLGNPRSDASARLLAQNLPAYPVLDVRAAQLVTGRSHVAVGKALAQLEAAGILRRLNERKWGRLWECPALLELVTSFEESIGTPPGR